VAKAWASSCSHVDLAAAKDTGISAELANPHIDPLLFDIVKSHMIHGPCGNLNNKSPCVSDRKCTKKYLRALIRETQKGKMVIHSTEGGDLGMVASPHTSICTTERLKLTTGGLFHTIQFYPRCFRPTLMSNGATP
jgi:hypothetical protein